MSFTFYIRNEGSRQSPEYLRRRREVLGSRAFARGYQQKAISDAELLFPNFESCLIYGAEPRDLVNSEWLYVAGLDLAGHGRSGTCLLVLAVSPDARRLRVPVEVRFGAWTGQQIAREVARVLRVWNVRHTKVETNALQDVFIEMIQMEDPDLELAGFHTSWNKRDPELGLPSLDREFERGQWRVPHPHYAERDCACDHCRWIQQMLNYPAVDNADGVMAAWFAREAAVELGPGLQGLVLQETPTDLPWRWRLGEATDFRWSMNPRKERVWRLR